MSSTSEPPSLPPSLPISENSESSTLDNHDQDDSESITEEPSDLPPSIPTTEELDDHSKKKIDKNISISIDDKAKEIEDIDNEQHSQHSNSDEIDEEQSLLEDNNKIETKQDDNKIDKLHEVEELNFSRLQPHEYATPQFLTFNDDSISWTNRILYFCAIVLIGYCIISEGTYMETDYAIGSAVLNLLGTGKSDLSKSNMATMVFDQYDLRIPEQEKNALFVATHIIGYKEQQRININGEQMKCIDASSSCKLHGCKQGEYTLNGGIATGKCINSKCEINGWCTAGNNNNNNKNNLQEKYDALISGVDSMIITFKINIEYPLFGVNKVYNNSMKIGDILLSINELYSNIVSKGIIIVINMHWKCNYYDINDKCIINWNIFRLDHKNTKNSGIFIWNSNYQSPQIIEINEIKLKILESRFLQKIYGIKILFNVTGEMKRFSIISLLINIGSMAGILSVIPTLFDIILRRRKEDYAKMKDTDMNEREKLHAKIVKQLLLEYLKGDQVTSDQ